MDRLFINDERFDSVYRIGTWAEWKIGMESTLRGWYSVYFAFMHDQLYHQEPFNEQPLTYEDWVEQTLDRYLREATPEEIARYDRLSEAGGADRVCDTQSST